MSVCLTTRLPRPYLTSKVKVWNVIDFRSQLSNVFPKSRIHVQLSSYWARRVNRKRNKKDSVSNDLCYVSNCIMIFDLCVDLEMVRLNTNLSPIGWLIFKQCTEKKRKENCLKFDIVFKCAINNRPFQILAYWALESDLFFKDNLWWL